MIDYSEKRDFIRMPIQCEITLHDGEAAQSAQLLDLSATGVRFLSQHALDTGAQLQLTVEPDNPITPRLDARVAVLRCDPMDDRFAIAATIEQIEPAQYPEND